MISQMQCPVSVETTWLTPHKNILKNASTKPNESQIAKIGRMHNSKVGHFGLDRILKRFKDRKDVWQFQRQHIRHFTDECACCQTMSMLKIPIHAHEFTTSTYTPMKCLNIDFIGPFPDKDIYSSSYAHSNVGWSYTGLLMLRQYLLQNVYYNILVASAHHVSYDRIMVHISSQM